MCLRLRENDDFAKPTEPILGYKYMYYTKTGTIKSVYNPEYRWKNGLNGSSRRTARVSESEIIQLSIDKGFHFFLDKGEAFAQAGDGYILIEFLIQPEDFVAHGVYCHRNSFVANKCTPTGNAWEVKGPDFSGANKVKIIQSKSLKIDKENLEG